VSEALLRYDLGGIDRDYTSLNLPIDPRDNVRRFVVKNMLFNIGLGRLLGFKKMLAAVRAGDYDRAAEEMMDSKWARQVKGRAVELAEMMRTGEYDPNKWR
jgi:lysozyme